MSNRMNIILLAALPLFAAAPAITEEQPETRTEGDVLVIEEVTGEPADEEVPQPTRETDRKVPARGTDMVNVRNVFGAPLREHPAVGEPPITRWDYDGYSVFFEHDKVLHTVVTE